MAKKKSSQKALAPQKTSVHSTDSKKQKLFDNLLKMTYEYIKGKSYTPQTAESLIERLNIHPGHRTLFSTVLESLKESGKVHYENKKYLPPFEIQAHEKIYRGQLTVHPRGFGFVNLPSPFQDIFIPKPFLNGAIDGDYVEALVDESIQSSKGPEGKIRTVIRRDRKLFVGTIVSRDNEETKMYSSALAANSQLISCPCLFQKKPLNRGDRVVFEVKEWNLGFPKKIHITQLLGSVLDPETDLPFFMHENGLPFQFPSAVQEEARSFGHRVSQSDMKQRVDLRALDCVTIDPDTAKDFDDAISVEKIGSQYRLGVHIADVSHYVKPKTALDREASIRCNSTYFPGVCIPMLPRELSENLCSLKPNVNRLAVSVFMNIDSEGNTLSWEIKRSVIRSKKRLTYKEAKSIIDSAKKSSLKPLLLLMVEIANLLRKRRTERGSVQLYMPEIVVKVDAHGKPLGLEKIEYDITHQMIEEFMLKANEIVAIHLNREGKEVSYRVHEEPAAESLRDFSALLSSFGYHLPEIPDPHDIQRFFQEIEGKEYAQYLATCYIKSMRFACYSADNIGHYGLSLEHYCHFTSPIRRYVDTVVHRLIFEEPVAKEAIQTICQTASERERISARAEGTVVAMKKLRLLTLLLEQEKERVFTALVTRVKPFGIYFDVIELMMEGFVHISELQDDYFIFNDHTCSLNGRFKGYDWKAGDSLLVRCLSADLILQDARWQLVEKIQKRPTEQLAPVGLTVKKKKKKKNA